MEHSLDVFAGVLIGDFRFDDPIKNFRTSIHRLTWVYAIGARTEPERHAEVDDESAARFKCLLDIHRGQFGILREEYFLSARHNGVEPVKPKPHILKIII